MLKNFVGWKTSRKILVIESDDWGSFRFKNRTLRDKYLTNPTPSDWMHYNDSFESYEDLKALSDVLTKHTDKHGNPACFTFLFNPANPDFNKIEASNFEYYFYENFLQILNNRKDGTHILEWYKEALGKGLIEIGFHGREHLNVEAWMADLKKRDKDTLKGFKDRIWGKTVITGKKSTRPHRSTYNIYSYDELESLKENIREGIALVNDFFSQRTTYFLPPDGPYHLSLNQTLTESGIKYIGLAKKHNNPLEKEWYQPKFFWMGKKTKEGLRVITRNVIFEPSSPRSNDWINSALRSIEIAFKFNNPAVISTHRPNYIGVLNPKNRAEGLEKLDNLLKTILKKWPEVEFMTSSQLGRQLS